MPGIDAAHDLRVPVDCLGSKIGSLGMLRKYMKIKPEVVIIVSSKIEIGQSAIIRWEMFDLQL